MVGTHSVTLRFATYPLYFPAGSFLINYTYVLEVQSVKHTPKASTPVKIHWLLIIE